MWGAGIDNDIRKRTSVSIVKEGCALASEYDEVVIIGAQKLREQFSKLVAALIFAAHQQRTEIVPVEFD